MVYILMYKRSFVYQYKDESGYFLSQNIILSSRAPQNYEYGA